MLQFIVDRLKEPSTYAGLAAVLAYVGINLGEGEVSAVMQLGVGLAAMLAAFLPEKLS